MKAWLGLVVFLCSFGATAASFDCARPGLTRTELAICQDPVLSARDDTLAVLYRVATTPVLVEGFESLQAFGYPPSIDLLGEQRAWIAARDRCEDRTCLVASYDKRIAGLEDFVDELTRVRGGGVLLELVSQATGIAPKDLYDLEVLWFNKFRGNTAYPEDGVDQWFDQVRAIVRFHTDDPHRPGGRSGRGWCGGSNLTHVLYLASDEHNRLRESAHLSNNNCLFGPGDLDGVRIVDGEPHVGYGEEGTDDYKPVYRIRIFGGSRWFEMLGEPFPDTLDADGALLRVHRMDGSVWVLREGRLMPMDAAP